MTPELWTKIILGALTTFGVIAGAVLTFLGGRKSNRVTERVDAGEIVGLLPTVQYLVREVETLKRDKDKLSERVAILEAEFAIAIAFIREILSDMVARGQQIPIIPEPLRRYLTDLLRRGA